MRTITFFLILPILLSCADETLDPKESFMKIYDDSNSDLSYKPIDVVETTDGFIILTATELTKTDFSGVQLLKIDQEGNYVSLRRLADYVVPVADLFLIDSISYFFAMNPTSLNPVLVGVNPQLELETEVQIGGVNYPLSCSLTSSGEFLLLSYDPVELTTGLSTIDINGTITGGNAYSIGPGDDVEEEIINHYLRATDRPLPFFCGEVAPGSYYFNGFYNYSFSLVFTNLGDTPSGVVQGQSSNAGIRAAMVQSGSDFAIAGFQFDDNFQLSSVSLSTTSISSSADLYTGNMAELKAYAPSKIIGYTLEGITYTIFASETESRQIALYFYDATSGGLSSIEYIGYQNPFELASLKVTGDNGLLILGTTLVAGRFERVALKKMSEKEIALVVD